MPMSEARTLTKAGVVSVIYDKSDRARQGQGGKKFLDLMKQFMKIVRSLPRGYVRVAPHVPGK
jgi:hypothetical protein